MNKLGKYEIRRELGKGAMGIVYEGFDPMIERKVALKTILPQGDQVNEDAMARFRREAQAAGRLNHPGIVAVYEYGEDIQPETGKKIAFIAMEFVQGRELRSFFDENQRFPLPEVERIMCEILAALGHAHANGVVHRDMKPGNLFVLANGHVKIGDFGIARIEASELTQVGTIMGTPAYMSPEQIVGQPVDRRSDLFSCGVILYQLLTGERPFTGSNTTTIMYKVMNETPPPPSALNVSLPAAFDAVVRKALEKSPDLRFQDAQEFINAIHGALQFTDDEDKTIMQTLLPNPGANHFNDPPTVIRPREPAANLHPAPAPSAAPAPSPAPTPTPSTPVPPAIQNQAGRPSRTPMFAAMAAAGLLLLGGGAYWLATSGQHNTPQLASGSASATASATPTPVATPSPAPVSVAANDPPQESGQIIISALGMADPKDPRFAGDTGAAQAEARADAKRQLVEKVAALYVDSNSLDKNYPVIEKKLLSNYGSFIKTVIAEGAPQAGKDGLLETETRAVLKVREVQRSLNQLSKEERIEFIRNNGDPKIAIQMTIANAETAQNLPSSRSQLAENVLKERIKSFGFRIWSNDGEVKAGPAAKSADFQILGEAKFKQLSARLPASGLTITKTVLTSWTVKAVDKASSEEIYLNTVMPKGQSWASEDLALADIGKQMGDEFSKDFFLQHFEFGVKKTLLNVQGVPDAQTARLLLRELRGVRQVLDVQMLGENGRYQLQLPEGSSSDILQDKFLKPLNTKLGQNCLSLAGASEHEVNLSFATSCKDGAMRSKLEDSAPASMMDAPDERRKAMAKAGKVAT